MLNLATKVDFDKKLAPFVVKLEEMPASLDKALAPFFPKELEAKPDGLIHCVMDDSEFTVHGSQMDSHLGDVLLCYPNRGQAQRLIRRNSQHNTLLFTERCDQLCVMCSQPPKNKDYSWIFPHYRNAVLLADNGIQIGISGGEPTLYLDVLLKLLEEAASKRPDLSFHILTNAQHFTQNAVDRMKAIHEEINVLWGIPLYSHRSSNHDKIVGKDGAFEILLNNLFLLGAAGTEIELRTVLTAQNVLDLPGLAKFVATNIPFISMWAIMAMEPIGYAKANKEQLFFDHSEFPEPLVSALDYAELRNLQPRLYNFPRCTIPATHRQFCTDSISDWKKKFLADCSGCLEKTNCCGFFEWYNEGWSWSGVQPIGNV